MTKLSLVFLTTLLSGCSLIPNNNYDRDKSNTRGYYIAPVIDDKGKVLVPGRFVGPVPAQRKEKMPAYPFDKQR